VAGLSDAGAAGAALLPAVSDLRSVSVAVAVAVIEAAVQDGLADADIHDPDAQVRAAMWDPDYPRIDVV
jgi:malate dehydrogenase (oxaloacetate-decarboxylating)